MPLNLHNTLTRTVEEFKPITEGKVTLYTCGPTVYDRPHVGNWTAYIYWDILVRALIASGYEVQRVMNITDVGHLVSDGDDGEDKLEKGARREGKTAWEIAEFYTKDFLAGMEKLGLIQPDHLILATAFIPQQLELVRVLKEKGYTYQTTDGIYFDTSKFPTYADFAHLDLAAQKAGARVEANAEKRQPWDFALWKFTEPGKKRDMEWETPDDLLELPPRSSNETLDVKSDETSAARDEPAAYASESRREAVSTDFDGKQASKAPSRDSRDVVMGFPGWHLECSAIAMSVLGPTIDIHTGGIDHIPVHHTNEIAQSEAASGAQFVKYWLHNNHLKIEGGKISKSLDNGYTLQDLEAKDFDAMDLRLFVLQSQFQNEGNFTFENLTAARNRRINWLRYAALRHQIHDRLRDDNAKNDTSTDISLQAASGAIREALQENLNTPEALRIIDETFEKLDNRPLDEIHRAGLVTFIDAIDDLLGMQLASATPDIDDEAKRLIIERRRAREQKDWQRSDEIRDSLKEQGIALSDTPADTTWSYLAN